MIPWYKGPAMGGTAPKASDSPVVYVRSNDGVLIPKSQAPTDGVPGTAIFCRKNGPVPRHWHDHGFLEEKRIAYWVRWKDIMPLALLSPRMQASATTTASIERGLREFRDKLLRGELIRGTRVRRKGNEFTFEKNVAVIPSRKKPRRKKR